MSRTLLPYQTRWVTDRAPLAVMQKGRRTGISWSEAYHHVMHASEGGGDCYYQSYDKDMTRGFIEDCAAWIEDMQVEASEVGETFLESERDIQVFRIDFPSGKKILSMTSNPRAFRSKGRPGDVATIDEAAFVDDIAEVLKAALAFVVWGGRVRVISTHNGEANAFNHLVRDVRTGTQPGSLQTVSFDHALADGLAQRVMQVQGREATQANMLEWERAVRQLYCHNGPEELDCIPAAGGGAWLSWDLIRAAEHEVAGTPDATGSGTTYIGVDVARRRDLWVATVIEEAGDLFWIREIVTLRDAPFSEQRQNVRRLVARYRPARILVDQTGMGEAVVEQYQDDHGRLRVEGVLMTGPRRLDVATALREAFEDRRMRIPSDDALRADLNAVRAEPGPTGAPRLIAERSGTDGHADRFWAMALAIFGARSALGAFEGETTQTRSAALSGNYGLPIPRTRIDFEAGVVRSVLDDEAYEF